MEIPRTLRNQMKALVASLSDNIYHVEHDIDMDGFASGIITTVALRRMGYEAYPYPMDRGKVFVPEKGALFLTDLALHGHPADIVLRASGEGKSAYAIDHHPWEENVTKYMHAYVNPHLAGVKDASQWNAGFLAYLTFRKHVIDYDWLAAISIYTDRCIAPWSKFLIDRYGYENVKRAGDMLTAYIAVTEDLSELDYILLNEIRSIQDVLERDEFRKAFDTFESAVSQYVDHYKDHAILIDREKKLLIVETEHPYRQINSVVSTRLSELPELRDWVIAVIGRDHEGAMRGSLRCRNFEERGVHMGKLADVIASALDGKGGGHPMAAGMRFPAERKEKFVKLLQSRL